MCIYIYCDLQTYQLFEKNHDTRSLQSRSHQDQSNRCAFQETIFCRDTWLRVRQRWEVDVDRVLLAILVRGTWPFPFKHRVLAGGSLETPLHLRSLVEKGTHCRALSLRLSQWCYPTHIGSGAPRKGGYPRAFQTTPCRSQREVGLKLAHRHHRSRAN